MSDFLNNLPDDINHNIIELRELSPHEIAGILQNCFSGGSSAPLMIPSRARTDYFISLFYVIHEAFNETDILTNFREAVEIAIVEWYAIHRKYDWGNDEEAQRNLRNLVHLGVEIGATNIIVPIHNIFKDLSGEKSAIHGYQRIARRLIKELSKLPSWTRSIAFIQHLILDHTISPHIAGTLFISLVQHAPHNYSRVLTKIIDLFGRKEYEFESELIQDYLDTVNGVGGLYLLLEMVIDAEVSREWLVYLLKKSDITVTKESGEYFLIHPERYNTDCPLSPIFGESVEIFYEVAKRVQIANKTIIPSEESIEVQAFRHLFEKLDSQFVEN